MGKRGRLQYILMKILFISAGNSFNQILPFIKSQEESIRDQGVFIDHFSLTQNKLRGIFGYLKAIKTTRKLAKENNYNLLHAHYSFCGWVAILASTGLPVVVSLMGTDVYGIVNKSGKWKEPPKGGQ